MGIKLTACVTSSEPSGKGRRPDSEPALHCQHGLAWPAWAWAWQEVERDRLKSMVKLVWSGRVNEVPILIFGSGAKHDARW